jgi:hypothetical protein
MDNEILAAIDAAGKAETAPVEDTGKPDAPPQPEVVSPTDAVPAGKAEAPAPTKETKPVWDGDVNKLPPELQDWAKAAQRKLTTQAMAEADIRRKGQQYEEIVTSEDWKAFQNFKTNGKKPAESAAPTYQPAGITPEEWEAAQLDSTGQVAQRLIDREVQKQLNAAINQYGGQLTALQQHQRSVEFKTALSDFADVHPDMAELHEDGLMAPFLKEEINSGKHGSHEAAIAAAYERAAAIRVRNEQRALAKHQGRVIAKKGAVTETGTTTGETTTFEVGNKNDVFDKAFEFALQKKKVKVKAKN